MLLLRRIDRREVRLNKRRLTDHQFPQKDAPFFDLDPARINGPFQPSQSFEGASLETYRKAALGTLPFGASNVSITKETADPQTGWTGYRFVIAYQLPGRSFVQIVTYLNFSDTQQILALTTTPANGLEAAEAMTSNLLGAWRKLRPGESIAVPPPL